MQSHLKKEAMVTLGNNDILRDYDSLFKLMNLVKLQPLQWDRLITLTYVG